MIKLVTCAIAGGFAAYGAALSQQDNEHGIFLMVGGVVIVILNVMKDYGENQDDY